MPTPTAQRQRRASARSRVERRSDQPLLIVYYWIVRHCVVPDGFRRGAAFEPYGWQRENLIQHYLVRGDAEWVPQNPLLRTAFVHRLSLIVGPQKVGKDPFEASQICAEGVGPVLFAGWAEAGEQYHCSDHGCRCGWVYDYDVGEPKGMPWPTPLIQIIAVSEDATQNTYDALRPMIELGPLVDIIPKTGEEFIRLPGGGRIDTVTSSALSRLGQRVTFASMGEAGIYTQTNGMKKVADTVLRGLAGIGGRGSMHTNAWDPAEHSTAQEHYESGDKTIWIQFDCPPNTLSFSNKEDRRKILRRVYPPDVRRENNGHVDLDAIEAEAVGLALRDPAQAARFFGNQLVTGSGKAFDLEQWDSRKTNHTVPRGAAIVAGFDGSRTDDHTALIACEIATGFMWKVRIWEPINGEIPRDQVEGAIDDLFHDFKVLRLNADPPYWKDELAGWQGRYGAEIVHEWWTYRNRPMGFAVRDFATALGNGDLTHDGDADFAQHIGNAHRKELNERDDKGVRLWTLQKEQDGSPRKIDAAVAAVLAWEARLEVIADGALNPAQTFRAFAV